MEYVVVSHKHQAIAAEGAGVVLSLNYRENKKVGLLPKVKKRIEELDSSIKKSETRSL